MSRQPTAPNVAEVKRQSRHEVAVRQDLGLPPLTDSFIHVRHHHLRADLNSLLSEAFVTVAAARYAQGRMSIDELRAVCGGAELKPNSDPAGDQEGARRAPLHTGEIYPILSALLECLIDVVPEALRDADGQGNRRLAAVVKENFTRIFGVEYELAGVVGLDGDEELLALHGRVTRYVGRAFLAVREQLQRKAGSRRSGDRTRSTVGDAQGGDH